MYVFVESSLSTLIVVNFFFSDSGRRLCKKGEFVLLARTDTEGSLNIFFVLRDFTNTIRDRELKMEVYIYIYI